MKNKFKLKNIGEIDICQKIPKKHNQMMSYVMSSTCIMNIRKICKITFDYVLTTNMTPQLIFHGLFVLELKL